MLRNRSHAVGRPSRKKPNVAALQGTPDQQGMQPPGRDDILAAAIGQHIRRAVGQPDPGPGGGNLHDRPGMVSRRVLHALVGRGDAERRAVVIGAVVQPGEPPVRRVHAAGDHRRAVRAEDDLRGLDLDLEGQPSPGQAVLLLQPPAQVGHRLDLRDRGDLGQGHGEARRQRPVAEQRGQEDVHRPDRPVPGGRLQALAPQPGERRRRPGRHGGGQRGGRADRVGVLSVVAAVAVAVLEVQPQVLDRLGGQLGADQRQHPGGKLRWQAHRGGEFRRAWREAVQRSQCPPAPLRGQVPAERVGGHVRGVHRLPAGPVSRVASGESPVGGGEHRVDLGDGSLRQPGRTAMQPGRTAVQPGRTAVASRHAVPVMYSGLTGMRGRSSPVAARIAAATAGPEEIVGASPAPRRP